VLNEAAVKVEVGIAEAEVRHVLHRPVLDRRVEVVDRQGGKVANKGVARAETAVNIADTSTSQEIIATTVPDRRVTIATMSSARSFHRSTFRPPSWAKRKMDSALAWMSLLPLPGRRRRGCWNFIPMALGFCGSWNSGGRFLRATRMSRPT
jgi:hypothetical protein